MKALIYYHRETKHISVVITLYGRKIHRGEIKGDIFLCWFTEKQRVKEPWNLTAKVRLNFPAFWKLEKNTSSGITHYAYGNSSRLGPRSMRSSAQIESGIFVPKVYGTIQVKPVYGQKYGTICGQSCRRSYLHAECWFDLASPEIQRAASACVTEGLYVFFEGLLLLSSFSDPFMFPFITIVFAVVMISFLFIVWLFNRLILSGFVVVVGLLLDYRPLEKLKNFGQSLSLEMLKVLVNSLGSQKMSLLDGF